MSNKQNKETWEKIPDKTKESLYREQTGTGIVPGNLTNHQISNLLKNVKKQSPTTGNPGDLPL